MAVESIGIEEKNQREWKVRRRSRTGTQDNQHLRHDQRKLTRRSENGKEESFQKEIRPTLRHSTEWSNHMRSEKSSEFGTDGKSLTSLVREVLAERWGPEARGGGGNCYLLLQGI